MDTLELQSREPTPPKAAALLVIVQSTKSTWAESKPIKTPPKLVAVFESKLQPLKVTVFPVGTAMYSTPPFSASCPLKCELTMVTFEE